MSTKSPHGNYGNYYMMRPSGAADARLHLFKKDWIKSRKVLDIGCNAGHLTCSLGLRFRPKHITGVDIDHDLIRGARRYLIHMSSRADPISYKKGEDVPDVPEDYFPSAIVSTHGQLHYNKMNPSWMFPNNVTFRQGDWYNDADEWTTYDTVLALSISKWIHLHHGDEGLVEFFDKIYRCLGTGGLFIFEPQGWNSYKSAVQEMEDREDFQQTLDKLKLRPEDFERILIETVGFSTVELIGYDTTDAKRPLYIYTK